MIGIVTLGVLLVVDAFVLGMVIMIDESVNSLLLFVITLLFYKIMDRLIEKKREKEMEDSTKSYSIKSIILGIFKVSNTFLMGMIFLYFSNPITKAIHNFLKEIVL